MQGRHSVEPLGPHVDSVSSAVYANPNDIRLAVVGSLVRFSSRPLRSFATSRTARTCHKVKFDQPSGNETHVRRVLRSSANGSAAGWTPSEGLVDQWLSE
jgi:hypothetical protein